MSCYIEGCREKAVYVRRDVALRLPGHSELVNVGDVKLCPEHERSTRTGARTRIRDEVITAALARPK